MNNDVRCVVCGRVTGESQQWGLCIEHAYDEQLLPKREYVGWDLVRMMIDAAMPFLLVLGFGLLAWVLSSSASAQVTMVDPFEPFRADNVRAEWEDDTLVSVSVTGTVLGTNENSQGVGYRSDEWFIDSEEWEQALTDFALQPANTDVREFLRAQMGVQPVEVGSGFVYPSFTLDTDPGDDQSNVNIVLDEAYRSAGDQWDNYVVAVVEEDHPVYGYCESIFVVYDAVANPEPDFHDPDSWDGEWGYLNFGPGEEGCLGITGELLYLPAPSDLAASVLPTTVGSDESPYGGNTGALNQQQRSQVANLTPGMQALADYATELYEAEAYEGYPTFTLYFGFFAGDADDVEAPEDEGDCTDGWCSGGGGSGGGEGGGLNCEENEGILACEKPDPGQVSDLDEMLTELEEANSSLTELTDGFITDLEEYELGDGPDMGLDAGACPIAGGIDLVGFDAVLDTDVICDVTGGPLKALIEWASYLAAAVIVIRGASA